MFSSFEEAHKYIVENGIEMIDLKFTDLWGRMRHLTIPASEFTPDILENGVGFDGFSVGFRPIESSDMVLIPDLSTGFVDPFWEAPTLSFICYAQVAGSNELFPDDPRSVALRAVEYMLDKGIADQSKWGVELEFWVFDSVAFENKNYVASYCITSEEFNPQGEPGHGYYNPHEGGYHSSPPQDSLYNLRAEISLHLQRLGFKLRYHHHEVGVPGQCEIETSMLDLMKAADAVTLAKYVTKMVAKAHGKTVTFMPKPLHNTAGTALHLHQQLFKEGRNLFYDPSQYGLLSEIGRYYVGGLLTHCPALLGLTNPSTNSYLRLVPGFEAPISMFFSVGNRSAAVRIPGYARQRSDCQRRRTC
ncbi:MAG: glutamine synthetase, partial [Candidatus Latescibacterota bacterium]